MVQLEVAAVGRQGVMDRARSCGRARVDRKLPVLLPMPWSKARAEHEQSTSMSTSMSRSVAHPCSAQRGCASWLAPGLGCCMAVRGAPARGAVPATSGPASASTPSEHLLRVDKQLHG